MNRNPPLSLSALFPSKAVRPPTTQRAKVGDAGRFPNQVLSNETHPIHQNSTGRMKIGAGYLGVLPGTSVNVTHSAARPKVVIWRRNQGVE